MLLVGHRASPELGAEPGNMWNWAWHLAAHAEVWIITHDVHRGAVDRHLERSPNPNLHCHWISFPGWESPWDRARGEPGIRAHYYLWQKAALRAARKLHSVHRFDIVHHVSWGTIATPPRLWRLGIPFLWGPLGGGQTVPSGFGRYLGRSKWKEDLRALRVRLSPFTPAMRKTAQKATLALATNLETANVLQQAGARSVGQFLSDGVVPTSVPATPPTRHGSERLDLLWAGRCIHTKGLPLALQALARADGARIRMRVAGDGPARQEWSDLVHSLHLEDRVQFMGDVPWPDMPALFQSSDAFVFTSLRDSFGAVVLEAMTHGLPVITLDHQGVGTFVPADAAIKVPVTTPEDVVAGLARSMALLASSPGLRRRVGERAWEFAKAQTWDKRALAMFAWYEHLTDGRERLSEPGSRTG